MVYRFMGDSRLSNGEIVKTTEIVPIYIHDNLFRGQMFHYLESDDEVDIIGNYGLRVFLNMVNINIFNIFYSSI